jgi:hypothetical protein
VREADLDTHITAHLHPLNDDCGAFLNSLMDAIGLTG